MKSLQINAAGAWRNCLTFQDGSLAHVREHAAILAGAAWPQVKLRISCGDTGRVLEYWTESRGWHAPEGRA